MPRNSSPPPSHAMKGMIKRCLEYILGDFKEREPSRQIHKCKPKEKSKLTKKADEDVDEEEGEDVDEVS